MEPAKIRIGRMQIL